MILDYCTPATVYLVIALIIFALTLIATLVLNGFKNANYIALITQLISIAIIYFILVLICGYVHVYVSWALVILYILFILAAFYNDGTRIYLI